MKIPAEMLDCVKLVRELYTKDRQNDLRPEDAEKIPNSGFVIAAAALGFMVLGTEMANHGHSAGRKMMTMALKDIGLIIGSEE